jgi:hypothetical protein
LACQFFGQEILSPHSAKYLAKFCEWERWISMGSQNFGYKPNNDQNLKDTQFFWQGYLGNQTKHTLQAFTADTALQ